MDLIDTVLIVSPFLSTSVSPNGDCYLEIISGSILYFRRSPIGAVTYDNMLAIGTNSSTKICRSI